MLDILKALASTEWGKQNELIISTFKAITQSILKYINIYHIKHQHQETASTLKHTNINISKLNITLEECR